MSTNTNNSANEGDDLFTDSSPTAPAGKPRRKCGNQPLDTWSKIYVNIDIEADGLISGPHPVLSFISAAYLANKTLVDMFEVNLETLAGAEDHPVRM